MIGRPARRSPMRAAIGLFLAYLLPPLVTLLAGGLAGAGAAWRTGQVDPLLWAPAALVTVAVTGFLLRRWSISAPLWAGLGVAGIVLIFAGCAALRWPDAVAAVALLAVALLAGAGGWLCARSGNARLMGGAALMVAGLIAWHGSVGRHIATAANRPPLAVMTALPLFWAEAGPHGTGAGDAPIVTLLRTHFDVMPIDDAAGLGATRARALLLAQPRALSPDQLAAIDAWVRAGGTALVLADPLLRWPTALPLGDRRRAPVVSGLDPLLIHWGFPRGKGMAGAEKRHFLADGALVTLSGADLFDGDTPAVRRRVGQGVVTLLGDADPIDDRLWLADPSQPLNPRYWVADTPALLLQWLGQAAPVAPRHWMRQGADVILALRYAIVAGMMWAILGAVLLRRVFMGRNGEQMR